MTLANDRVQRPGSCKKFFLCLDKTITTHTHYTSAGSLRHTIDKCQALHVANRYNTQKLTENSLLWNDLHGSSTHFVEKFASYSIEN